jgi:secreted trypsin-like serine protease
LPPEYVAAQLGRHDLNVTNEFGAVQYLVWDVVLHPDWNFNEEKYDADISIVVLTDRVEFNQRIQPVCLPNWSYEEVKGTGIIVGWGKSEFTGSSRYENRLNQLVVPAINASHCYTTFHVLAQISSNRAFCGGYENEQRSACLGDSGGGFYLLESSRWVVRGIISASIIDFDIGCDINSFSIYTNVARFVDWINEVMKKTKIIAWKAVEFKCFKNLNHGSTL